jgi:hypothetical protein
MANNAAAGTVPLLVEVAPDLKVGIKSVASDNERTIAAEVRRALRAHIAAHQNG